MKMFRFSDCELDSSQFANSFVQDFTDLMEAAEVWVADDSEGRTWDVANWPAVRKLWKCEIRSVHSLVCGPCPYRVRQCRGYPHSVPKCVLVL